MVGNTESGLSIARPALRGSVNSYCRQLSSRQRLPAAAEPRGLEFLTRPGLVLHPRRHPARGRTAVAVRLILRTREPRVERAVFTANLLTALEGLGRTVWTHQFSGTLAEPRVSARVFAYSIRVGHSDGFAVVILTGIQAIFNPEAGPCAPFLGNINPLYCSSARSYSNPC